MSELAQATAHIESVDKLTGLLGDLGITRLGNLTNLDTLGIPVWFAARPNSRGLSVSQGKGIANASAQVAAIMEAAETAVAEQHEKLHLRRGSLSEMTSRGLKVVSLDSMARCTKRAENPDIERSWCEGYMLGTAERIFAPYELVGMDMRPDSGWDYTSFQMSSVGLAAGATRDAAIVHALLELIECDTALLSEFFGLAAPFARPLRYQAGIHEGLDEAVERAAKAGVTPHFYSFSGATGLPVVACYLVRTGDGTVSDRVEGGVACRLNAAEAAYAALIEAAQSRLIYIAGARDDIDAIDYSVANGDVRLAGPDDLSFCDVRSVQVSETGSPVDHIVSALTAIGIDDICVFPLTPVESPFQVVRVLVPHLTSGATDKVVKLAAHHLAWLGKAQ